MPAGKVIHVVLDNYAAHKHPKVRRGSTGMRASPSTSCRPRAPGSTPSRASSPSSHDGASSAASSDRSSTSRSPSTASSPRQQPSQNPSPGPPIPTKSSLPSGAGIKCWIQSTSLTFENFRSFVDPVSVPFDKRITFVVGPNNSGKSNVLRFLAILFNRANKDLDELLDFPGEKKEANCIVTLPKDFLINSFPRHPRIVAMLKKSVRESLDVKLTINKSEFRPSIARSEQLFELIPSVFLNSSQFLDEFGQSSDAQRNVAKFFSEIKLNSIFAAQHSYRMLGLLPRPIASRRYLTL